MGDRWDRVVAAARELSEDYRRTRSSLAAGGLSYFVALSLAPAALAFGTLAGLLLNPSEVRQALDRLAERAPDTFEAVRPLGDSLVTAIESASGTSFTLATVVGLLVAVYASSKVVLGLRMAMNTAFDVTETRSGLLERGIATIVTLVALIVGVALIVLLTVVPKILSWLGLSTIPVTTGVAGLDWAIVIALVFLAVRWLLQHAPDQSVRVPWLSLGAWTATLGISASTVGVGIYAHFSSTISTAVLLFGTAIVILLWLYLCFVALLFGAVIEARSQRLRTRTTGEDQPQAR